MSTISALPIAPPAGAVTACQKCGECCRRYAISTLPHELERQAKFFKLSEEKFIAIYTRLLVQLLPFHSSDHPLSMHVNMLPKEAWDMLKKMGFEGEYVIILPMIGFKKDNYCVFFDPQSFGCTMHLVKPMQCTLFPFTSLKDNEDYAKAYDFCELSKISSPTRSTTDVQKFHNQEWKTFFDKVAFWGMEKAYPHWPEKGDVVYNGKIIAPIDKKQLQALLKLASGKKKKKKVTPKKTGEAS